MYSLPSKVYSNLSQRGCPPSHAPRSRLLCMVGGDTMHMARLWDTSMEKRAGQGGFSLEALSLKLLGELRFLFVFLNGRLYFWFDWAYFVTFFCFSKAWDFRVGGVFVFFKCLYSIKAETVAPRCFWAMSFVFFQIHTTAFFSEFLSTVWNLCVILFWLIQKIENEK